MYKNLNFNITYFLAQKLSNNQWVEGVSGILQNCVSVLKLCHLLTDKMSKIQLNQISPQLNDVICQATTRVVPRFDILLRSLAAKNVDIRIIEARVAALVTACWALVTPFYLLNPKYEDKLGSIVHEMEVFHSHLQLALEQVEGDYSATPTSSSNNPPNNGANLQQQQHLIDNEKEEKESINDQNPQHTLLNINPPLETNVSSDNSTVNDFKESSAPILIKHKKTSKEMPLLNGIISLRCEADEATTDLLNDEAPADPACS